MKMLVRKVRLFMVTLFVVVLLFTTGLTALAADLAIYPGSIDNGDGTFTVVLQPGPGANNGADTGGADSGKDAWVQYHNGSNGSGTNAGHWTQWPSNFNAEGWGLYQFDVSSIIPPSVEIIGAELVLHQDFRSSAGSNWVSGPETFILESIGAAWDEMTVKWNTRPAKDNYFSTTLTVNPNPVPSIKIVIINITDLVKGWYNGAEQNNGFIYRMADRGFYNMQDHYVLSSDNIYPERRPKLLITFKPEQPTDNTPPVIVPTITGTLGHDNWYTSDVTVSWTITDSESEVTSIVGDETTNITQDTSGITLTCTATSIGGTSSASITIKRDATAPVVTLITPEDGAEYLISESIEADWTAFDALSGMANIFAGIVDTSTPGAKTISVTAVDIAGNETNLIHGYNVLSASEAIDRLIAKVRSLNLQKGTENSLIAKLNAAKASLERGQDITAVNQLSAFIKEVLAQSGKKITISDTDDLVSRATRIIAAIQ